MRNLKIKLVIVTKRKIIENKLVVTSGKSEVGRGKMGVEGLKGTNYHV